MKGKPTPLGNRMYGKLGHGGKENEHVPRLIKGVLVDTSPSRFRDSMWRLTIYKTLNAGEVWQRRQPIVIQVQVPTHCDGAKALW